MMMGEKTRNVNLFVFILYEFIIFKILWFKKNQYNNFLPNEKKMFMFFPL